MKRKLILLAVIAALSTASYSEVIEEKLSLVKVNERVENIEQYNGEEIVKAIEVKKEVAKNDKLIKGDIKNNAEAIRKNFSDQYMKNKDLEAGIKEAKSDAFKIGKGIENNISTVNDGIVKNDGRIKILEGKTEAISDNGKATKVNETNITKNETNISNNSNRISDLDNKVNNLQGEMNKGFAMSAAMSTVDFQALEVGELGIGAGVGNYQNAQAVSLGLGLRATDNLSLNVKGAMSTGTKQETMVGAGATYKIRVFGS